MVGPKSLAPDHAGLTVLKTTGCAKIRLFYRVAGLSPPVKIFGFNNDIETLVRAVKERVYYVKVGDTYAEPPRPSHGWFQWKLQYTFSSLCRLLPRTAPLSYQQFVDTFKGRKKVIYTNARDSLLVKSVSRKDANVKVFVKYEKTNFTSKTNPVPRVISPRDPRFNLEIGRYIRPIEERIFKSIAKLFGQTTVVKGYNALDSGRLMFKKWNSFVSPVAIGLDASRFDQHVSLDALKWEHSIYLECFPHKRYKTKFMRLLNMQLFNKCSGYVNNGSIKYKLKGGRMSGDMNTSLGNCVLMCAMVYQYAHDSGVNIQLANNGDDCVVFLEHRDLPRFNEGLHDWFELMGFDMVAEEPCFIFEQLEFCQTHPVWVGPNADDYLMVRHPVVGAAKDTVCIHDFKTEKLFRGWLHAVGTGGLVANGGIPIFQDFYTAFIKHGSFYAKAHASQSWGVRQLSKGMTRGYQDIHPMTRASFYWAFGFTPDEQECIEAFYREFTFVYEKQTELVFQPPMPGFNTYNN